MKLRRLEEVDSSSMDWSSYDLIVLASGFEARSAHILSQVPDSVEHKVLVLGFHEDRSTLSRPDNDRLFTSRGMPPLVCESALGYEEALRSRLQQAVLSAGGERSVRILIDYSVMTRAWYAMVLTWLRYRSDNRAVEADFLYSHGEYMSKFEPLRIQSVTAIPGFEGACTGSRSTAAVFGLGFDKFALLALYEQIEPDSLVCFLAQEAPEDPKTERALRENSDVILMSESKPIFVPLSNLAEIYRLLYEAMNSIAADSEIVAVPMGPKPHVLGTLLVAQAIPRITCLHARGYRHHPVEVRATGQVSAWRLSFA